MTITGVILAGGYSTRMGKDKCSLSIANKTMLEYAITCMKSISHSIRDIYISCRKDSPLQTSYPRLYDHFIGIGPISGIYSALNAIRQPCLFIPVDIPGMKPEFLMKLIDTYNEKKHKDFEMICFQSEKGIVESLVSIFSPQALHSLQTSIKRGIYKITKAIPREKQYYIPYTHGIYSFYNVNTPQDIITISAHINEDIEERYKKSSFT